MNKKKGFTLIELLAIIVILAIIAVITVPIILNIIDDAEKNSAMDSAHGYKDALQKYYATKSIQNPESELPSGYVDISELPSDFTVSGENPSNGWVKLKKGIVDKFSLKYKNYVVTMDNDKNVTSEKQENVDPHVPDEYQEVEYLESTGTQYIDTGYKPNGSTKVETLLETKDIPTSNKFFYGSRNNVGNSGLACGTQPKLIGAYGSNNEFNVDAISANKKYRITQTNELIINNNVIYSYSKQNFSGSYNFLIFAVNNGTNGVDFKSNYKFYNMKIYDNGVLTRYFVPVVRKSDNKSGMLDLANLSKNLFDKENATIVNRYVSTDKKIATSSNARSIIIPCQPNTTYTFSKIQSTRFYLGYTTAEIETGTDVYNNTIDNNATYLTITTGENAKYLVVYVYNSVYDTNTTLEEILDSAQLEFGSIATQYEPYKKSFYTNDGEGEFIAGPEI